jgi:hypothetical protein
MPFQGDQSCCRANDKEIVGIGEEPDTRDDHGSAVKLAGRSFIQKIGDRLRPRAGVADLAMARLRLRRSDFSALCSEHTSLLLSPVTRRPSEDERCANKMRNLGYLSS